MISLIRSSALVLLFLTFITGAVYPAIVWGLGRTVYAPQAQGSLIKLRERVVGSELIGQNFTQPQYFWGRPSATTPAYNASASAGSNLGPTNPALTAFVQGRIAVLRAADPGAIKLVPVDLVTASGSGLDPHISPAAVYFQLARVARARGLGEAELRLLVNKHTEKRKWGLLGEPRVNVLRLNLALDQAVKSGS